MTSFGFTFVFHFNHSFINQDEFRVALKDACTEVKVTQSNTYQSKLYKPCQLKVQMQCKKFLTYFL